MSQSEIPCLSLAIKRLEYGRSSGKAATHTQESLLQTANHFAIWVLKAPYPGGSVHHDCFWPETLTHTLLDWQEMFSLRGLPDVPFVHYARGPASTSPPTAIAEANPQTTNYGGRLMQHLAISLWQWLFDGPIQNSLERSQGIAIGQKKLLRLRLDIRDPVLIALPWEIMQPQTGKRAISLDHERLLFSRTTSEVEPLTEQRLEQALKVLLVLGHDSEKKNGRSSTGLQLEQEASALVNILKNCGQSDQTHQKAAAPVLSHVNTLLQPTRAELIDRLDTGEYNILFYAGHGVPAPDGGLLFLQSDTNINGTELAQVLVRCGVKLAVFNACWGAQPERHDRRSLPRSSLAEVLIHQGVPAVLGMRDSIADREARSFIQVFASALAARKPIDQAVAVARQNLLTLYKFNQPAWTLPVLYMHPEFDGELLAPAPTVAIGDTIIPPGSPHSSQGGGRVASLGSIGAAAKVWPIRGGIMRVGSSSDNDLVLQEPGVSRKHAEIFCRTASPDINAKPSYFLRDDSRYGTLILGPLGWQRIQREEVALQSGVRLKFGSSEGQTFEFIMEGD